MFDCSSNNNIVIIIVIVVTHSVAMQRVNSYENLTPIQFGCHICFEGCNFNVIINQELGPFHPSVDSCTLSIVHRSWIHVV